MILNQTLTLEAVLYSESAVYQPEVTVDYVDWYSTGETTLPQTYRSALNGLTDVTILAAPSQQTQAREVIRVSLYNKDTVSVLVTIKTTDGTTDRIISKQTLDTLETLHFEKDRGWYKTPATTTFTLTNPCLTNLCFAAWGDGTYEIDPTFGTNIQW